MVALNVSWHVSTAALTASIDSSDSSQEMPTYTWLSLVRASAHQLSMHSYLSSKTLPSSPLSMVSLMSSCSLLNSSLLLLQLPFHGFSWDQWPTAKTFSSLFSSSSCSHTWSVLLSLPSSISVPTLSFSATYSTKKLLHLRTFQTQTIFHQLWKSSLSTQLWPARWINTSQTQWNLETTNSKISWHELAKTPCSRPSEGL